MDIKAIHIQCQYQTASKDLSKKLGSYKPLEGHKVLTTLVLEASFPKGGSPIDNASFSPVTPHDKCGLSAGILCSF